MKSLLRGLWLLSAISILALPSPLRAEAPQRHAPQADCCAHMPTHHGHCGGEPAKSQDRQCCAACLFGLPLINVAPVPYVFSTCQGETLLALALQQTARSARPPVPPPRA